ncbi:ricin B-like lectin R40C1 isoform X4 [Oryza brachyantha]|uniref:ricin B-like lectin R40C1 isoform X4 n=1 Tax=Oryza brachyantha TaxID=4533 RepID=UPI00077638ED|nr:ricin B-like lectin R40C1 isoform X4 [Oryza brachyantha]
MLGGQPMRIYCKGDTGLNMAVRGDKVLLVPADSNDESQWIQDYDAVGRVADEQGRRAFALVNVRTKQAAVLLDERSNRLEMARYAGGDGGGGGGVVKLSMLWSLGARLPGGYCEVRLLRDISRTLNGINGHVREGTVVGIYNSEPDSVHAIWKFDPINK